MDYELTEATDADAVAAAVRHGIRAADPPDVGPRDWRPLTLALRAPDGTLVGGLYGATMWGWLLVDGLWVAEALRGRGQGQRLLLAAEEAARARGCRGAWLGTFDFQARAFYERQGYRVFGEIPEFPAGHSHYELRKLFGAAPANADP
jgi:ribosomal protein S18 acetylase RimI-like enzyme